MIVVVYRVSLHRSEVLRVFLGVYLPLRALVIHRVLQTVPVFAMGGVKARVRVPRAPVLVQVLESGQVPIRGCPRARVCTPNKVVFGALVQGDDIRQDAVPVHPEHKAFGTLIGPYLGDVFVIDFWTDKAHGKSAAKGEAKRFLNS